MYVATTIPQDVLGRLRDGARGALLEPLAKLRWQAEHEPPVRPEYTNELLAQIRRAVGLLHVLGWSADDATQEMLLDTVDYGPALCEALTEAARSATVELKDAEWSDRAEVVRTVLPLSAFAAVVEAACMDRAGRDPGVHLFQESLQVLLAEIEREEPDTVWPDPCSCTRLHRMVGGRGRSRKCCV